MTAPARLLCPPRPMAHDTDPDPLLEIARLKRDLRSLQARDRAQRRALFELKAGGNIPLTSVATAGTRGSLPALLAMAQHAERHGRVPVIRWTRDAGDRINGVELLFITPDVADEGALDTLPTGMACISGDESA